MMQLAVSANPVAAQAAPPHIINSADSGAIADACALDIEREVAEEMKLMGAKRWQELCTAAKQAHQTTGIDTGMSIGKAPGASRPAEKR